MKNTLYYLAAVIALLVGYWYAAPLLFPDDDNGLGAGLTAFMMLGAIALAGGFWDGLREPHLMTVALRWTVISVAVGVVLPVLVWANEDDTGQTLFDDLVIFIPFMLAIMGIPALVSALLGRLCRPTERPTPHRQA